LSRFLCSQSNAQQELPIDWTGSWVMNNNEQAAFLFLTVKSLLKKLPPLPKLGSCPRVDARSTGAQRLHVLLRLDRGDQLRQQNPAVVGVEFFAKRQMELINRDLIVILLPLHVRPPKVAAIADCHIPDEFKSYRSPQDPAAQRFWLFQESRCCDRGEQGRGPPWPVTPACR